MRLPHPTRSPRRILLWATAGATSLGVAAMAAGPGAFAATGTTSATITGGSLSVGSVVAMTALKPAIGGTATGALPSAQWADDTGSGLGWNGTVAVSPLNFTGTWMAGQNGGSPSTAITSTAAGSYAGTADGVSYTVTVTTATTAGVTTVSYTSTDPADPSGSNVAVTNGTATAIGTKGIKITLDLTGLYKVGDTYTVLCGTQAATALAVDTAAATAITSTSTSSPAPTYQNNAAGINAGTTVGTVNTLGAVKILSAALGQGASGTGYYTAAPGVQITADSNSWAATYSGNLTYTIAAGP